MGVLIIVEIFEFAVLYFVEEYWNFVGVEFTDHLGFLPAIVRCLHWVCYDYNN